MQPHFFKLAKNDSATALSKQFRHPLTFSDSPVIDDEADGRGDQLAFRDAPAEISERHPKGAVARPLDKRSI
jgi:hypothetical protein